jgi:hypothetical protein
MDIETLRREVYSKYNYIPRKLPFSSPGCLMHLLWPSMARTRIEIINTFNKSVKTMENMCENDMRIQIVTALYKYDDNAIEWAISSAIDNQDIRALGTYRDACAKYPKEACEKKLDKTNAFLNKYHEELRLKQIEIKRNNTRTHWNRILGYAIDDDEFQALYKVEQELESNEFWGDKWCILDTLQRNNKILFDKYNILKEGSLVKCIDSYINNFIKQQQMQDDKTMRWINEYIRERRNHIAKIRNQESVETRLMMAEDKEYIRIIHETTNLIPTNKLKMQIDEHNRRLKLQQYISKLNQQQLMEFGNEYCKNGGKFKYD